MRTHSTTFQVTLALLLVSSVFSWGEVGHLLVTQITEYDLIARNYSDVFNKARDLVLKGADLTPRMTKTFQGAAIYADELKFMQNINEFDEMHYFDMIFNPNGIPVRLEGEKPNALSFIYKAINAFNSTKQGPYTWTHTFLLRMLLHIVGDMHQPLHMTTLYSEEFLAGDQGGNKFKIHYANKSDEEARRMGLPNNLHSYWDQGAGLFPSFPARPLPVENQTWVKDYAAQMFANYTRDSFKSELAEKNVTKWGQAIFNISRDSVYPPLMNNGHTVTPNYTDTMYPIMLKAITLAGYRLSDILVSLFGTAHEEHEVRATRLLPLQPASHFRTKGYLAEKMRAERIRLNKKPTL